MWFPHVLSFWTSDAFDQKQPFNDVKVRQFLPAQTTREISPTKLFSLKKPKFVFLREMAMAVDSLKTARSATPSKPHIT